MYYNILYYDTNKCFSSSPTAFLVFLVMSMHYENHNEFITLLPPLQRPPGCHCFKNRYLLTMISKNSI